MSSIEDGVLGRYSENERVRRARANSLQFEGAGRRLPPRCWLLSLVLLAAAPACSLGVPWSPLESACAACADHSRRPASNGVFGQRTHGARTAHAAVGQGRQGRQGCWGEHNACKWATSVVPNHNLGIGAARRGGAWRGATGRGLGAEKAHTQGAKTAYAGKKVRIQRGQQPFGSSLGP